MMGLLILCLLTALVKAVIPFLAYTLGLRSVETSKAGILATIEPMAATLIGTFVFSEPLTFMSGLGILLILAAVVVLHISAGGSGTGGIPGPLLLACPLSVHSPAFVSEMALQRF